MLASARPGFAAEPVASPVPVASPPAGFDPMAQLSLGSGKDPIMISADQLDFDWQNNKVVYKGKVHATQGDLVIDSDTLTINFLRPDANSAKGKRETKDGGAPSAGDAKKAAGDAKKAGDDAGTGSGDPTKPESGGLPRRSPTLRDVVAEGHVVITQKKIGRAHV